MSLTPSVLLKPPAPAPHGKEPPGAPPDTPFAAVLDDHQARTAVAEGRQTRPDVGPRRGADRPAQPAGDADAAARPAHDGAASDAGASGDDGSAPAHPRAATASAALAALLGGVPLPVGVAAAVAARLPVAPATSAEAAPAPANGLPGAPASVAPGAAPAAGIPTGPSVPAAATTLPLGPAQSPAGPTAKPADLPAPAASAPAGAVPGANGDDSTAGALQALATRTARLGAGLAAKAACGAGTSASAAPAATAAGASAGTPAPTAAHGAAPARGAQPAAAPATVAAAAPTATSTGGAQAAAGADDVADQARGVGLEHAVETVRLALRAAADRGVTHARISLNPRELGAIEVHLRQTADGLVARVVAQHAAAAQLLQDNGADLRRQLEQSGLNLLQLDIGASDDDARRPGERAFGSPSARQPARDADDPLAPAAGAAETTATATLALPNGALVDVLA